MKINFVSIESSRPKWAETAFDSYKTKFNKSIAVNWTGIKPISRNKNYSVSEVVKKESNLLASKVRQDNFVIALDKGGSELSTERFKVHFDNWISNSKDLSLIIGGPDGLSNALIEKSDFCWSLSNLTFPHSIVPVLALEQIYRVWSITQNHPYHK